MRYSTRTRYGLRFLINLAGRPAGSCVQLAEIAREEGVSVKYLEQIVRVLRPAGILRSARGAKGGYALAKSPDAIRMDEVFERLEGHISPVECLHGAKSCEREGVCPTRWFWRELDDHMRMFLKGMTLARFVERERALKTEKGTFPVEMDGPACFHALHRTPPEGGGTHDGAENERRILDAAVRGLSLVVGAVRAGAGTDGVGYFCPVADHLV